MAESRIGARSLFLPLLVLLMAFAAMGPASNARADYTPSRHYAFDVGTGGTLVWNQSTVLNTTDMVSAWNYWTGYSYLSTTSSPSTCGSSNSCVYVMNEGATVGSCTAPMISDTGTWAVTYLEAYPYVNNIGCDWGNETYPVYIIVPNSSMSFTATQLQHIRRHEMAHVLGLADANVTCWFSTVWYPIMNNGTFGNCSAYPQNATATANEAYYAAQWGFFD